MFAPTSTLLLFLASALANPVSRSSPPALTECLNDNGLNVEVAQSPNWQTSTTPFNTRFHYTPAAIVYPTQTSDVSKAVECAAKFRIHVSALSGGHSYSASGYGSQDGALVIMFRDMAKITYSSSDGMAIIQPGIRLGDVATELYDKYGRAMAHGICPYVGGTRRLWWMGLSSRSWGLLIDQVVAADMVLANGTVVHVTDSENPDLFFAIRGASPSYGIVTQYTFQTHQAPTSVIRFAFNFIDNDRSADKFAKLLRAYQTWGLTAPKEMGIVANVWQAGRDVEMAGYYMGSQADFDRVSGSLLSATGQPTATYIQERGWITALTEADGGSSLSTQGAPNIHDTFFAKSLVIPTSAPLTSDAFSALAKYFTTTPLPDSLSWFIQFELWGGGDSAISSVPAAATAFPHRAHHITTQFYVRSTGSWSTQGTAFGNGLVSAITSAMEGRPFGAYANYIDPELSGWREKYYAGNYERLAAIQAEVDPSGVFMKAQNIGAPDS
ncbi:FAD-binding domain-containing protein [Mycena sp. CBHHK59/15]|nr:FAD-binding domain-containing protein [Mycena sp. CBHHK59/15]